MCADENATCGCDGTVIEFETIEGDLLARIRYDDDDQEHIPLNDPML